MFSFLIYKKEILIVHHYIQSLQAVSLETIEEWRLNHESILTLSGCRTQFAGQDYKNLILPTSKIIANSRDKEEQVYFKMPVTKIHSILNHRQCLKVKSE